LEAGMKEIPKMKVDEFVKRLRQRIDYPDYKMTFFIGAGCSVTSGIPTASSLVKEWLKRLWKIKVGESIEYEVWLKKYLPDFREEKTALYYGKVIEDLFIEPIDRQEEWLKLTSGRDPGFGYAVLAQLIAKDEYCRHCNHILTTNFDDLIADALYLYTRKKPLVISHESLLDFARTSSIRPTVIKLHGDVRLEMKNTPEETKNLTKKMSNTFNELLKDRGLIFIGYGGNDDSIYKALSNLPSSSLPNKVFWIGKTLPEDKLYEWLKRDGKTTWVEHFDFDELMLLFLNEFNLEHPKQDRFETLFESYKTTFEKLQKGIESKPEKEKKPFDDALDKAIEKSTDWWAVQLEANKHEKTNPGKADIIYQKGIEKFPQSFGLLGNYANFLKNIRKDYDQAEKYYRLALEKDPNHATNLGNYANFLKNIRKDYDQAEKYYRLALEKDPNHANNLGNYANFLDNICKDYDQAEKYYRLALEKDPNHANNLGNYTLFLYDIRKDYDQAEKYFRLALEKDPNHVANLGNYANFLKNIRKDYDQAEKYYRLALEKDPNHATNLGNYAGLLLGLGREEGFLYLNNSLNISKNESPSQIYYLECLFYQYAHLEAISERKEALKKSNSLWLTEFVPLAGIYP
jgi:Tfp pilus assembly protein PilF/NAD-dependent SIR2 family protein deacetylase